MFRHAVEVTTDNYTAENVLGKAYERAGNNEAALACYDLSVKTEPRFPQSQFNLAMCLMTFGRVPEALEHLQAAAALDPGDPDVQYDLGIYFTQHESWTNAVNCFSNSLSVRPGFAMAQLCLGTALANVGNAPRCRAAFSGGAAAGSKFVAGQNESRPVVDGTSGIEMMTDYPAGKTWFFLPGCSLCHAASSSRKISTGRPTTLLYDPEISEISISPASWMA